MEDQTWPIYCNPNPTQYNLPRIRGHILHVQWIPPTKSWTCYTRPFVSYLLVPHIKKYKMHWMINETWMKDWWNQNCSFQIDFNYKKLIGLLFRFQFCKLDQNPKAQQLLTMQRRLPLSAHKAIHPCFNKKKNKESWMALKPSPIGNIDRLA